MEDTALKGASALLHDPIHQTDQSKLQHYTNGGMLHSQADQHELIRVEPSEVSEQARARGRKHKLSEAQKREKKRQCDVNYRLKKKIKVNEMTAQIKSLQEEIGRLSTENRRLKEHIRQLKSKGKLPAEVLLQREGSYISQSTSPVDHQSVYVQEMTVQNKCFQEEIGHLKEKTGRLTTEKRRLEEHIRQLQSQGKLPVENVQILTRINITTQHCLSIEAENSELRAQVMELSERLQFLNEIISFIEPAEYESESDSFLNPWNSLHLNQPIMTSADFFQRLNA